MEVTLRIYKIDLDYIKHLHSQDDKVQYNSDYTNTQNQNRPYIGPILIKDGISFYAPLEHPRSVHTKLKESSYLIKIDGGKYGLIGINNMIPVPDDKLIDFDISKDKHSKVLISQFVFCKKHIRELVRKANKVYVAQTNPDTAHTQYSSCNFIKLKNSAYKFSNHKHIQSPILPNEIVGFGFTQSF